MADKQELLSSGAGLGAAVAAETGTELGDLYGTNGLDPNTLLPVGPLSHVQKLDGSGTSLFILGSDSQLGRDEFLRLLYGARVSLEVAIGATILGMVVGVLMGAIAGYFG